MSVPKSYVPDPRSSGWYMTFLCINSGHLTQMHDSQSKGGVETLKKLIFIKMDLIELY